MMQNDGMLTADKSLPHKIRNRLEHAAPTLVTFISILLETLCSQPRQGPSAFLGCGLDIAFNTLLKAPTFVMTSKQLLGVARLLSVAAGREFLL